jgi:CubicO group peptidase (beta-lactamase class C family)
MKNNLIELVRQKTDEISFSGVVGFRSDGQSHQEAFGYRDRANKIENTTETRFGLASGTKGFTALGIATLISEGKLELDTTAHLILGTKIKNLHPDITIRQLLAHTSGIGDYYDEDEIGEKDDFILSIPVQDLVSPLDYIPLLEEKKQKFQPGTDSSYSNSGYIALAIVIEVIASIPYQEFVEKMVFAKANMEQSGFFRSDCLPDNTALGYVSKDDPLRTNIFNLPVLGGGDGGAYSTLADMSRFWECLKSFQTLPESTLESFLKAQNTVDDGWYGYGFWIDRKRDYIQLVGHDAGVSFYSSTSRTSEDGFTIISNTSSGAWTLARLIKQNTSDNSRG